MYNFFKNLLKFWSKFWKTLIIITVPLALSPLVISDSIESKCAFVVLLMAIFWTTEPIPLPVTALLPVVLLPTLGISSTEKACAPYLKGANMLFMGCLILALAIEKSNVHQRIALKVLLAIGTQFHWIVLGFMLTSMFVSMWIISTASVAMMVPIADVILDQLFPEKNKSDKYNVNNKESSMIQPIINESKLSIDNDGYEFTDAAINREKISKILYLSIAYSSTIGGVTTLTSNGPNMVLKFILEETYDGRDPVDYTSWLLFAAPFTIIATLVCWFIYKLLFMRNISVAKEKRLALKHVLTKKYEKLGPITFHEFGVISVLLLMIFLYIFHDPQFMTGWSKIFLSEKNNIKPKAATAGIFTVILLFIIPRRIKGPFPSPPLLDWKSVQSKFAWGLIILRGGGYSIADAVSSSGLSKLIGHQLAYLNILPLPCLIIVLAIVGSILAEFMRTSATATILLPVAIELANDLGINPLLLLIPITIGCAYSFMLPVGTSASTIVYDHANLKVSDLLIPGIIAKVICMILMLGNVYILGFPMFSLSDSNPEWTHNQLSFNNDSSLVI